MPDIIYPESGSVCHESYTQVKYTRYQANMLGIVYQEEHTRSNITGITHKVYYTT